MIEHDVIDAQKLILLDDGVSDFGSYNILCGYKYCGDLDEKKISEAIDILVLRHETLRTTFHIVDDRYVARINGSFETKVFCYRCKGLDLIEACREFVKPFDIEKLPLFRVGIFYGEDCSVLMIDFHHSIVDKASIGKLIEEFMVLFRGEPLSGDAGQFQDYVSEMQSQINLDIYKNQEKYWLKKLERIEVGDYLNYSKTTSVRGNYIGSIVNKYIDGSRLKKLREIAMINRVSMYIMMLAIFNLMLSKYSGRHGVIITTPIDRRKGQRFADVAGVFINVIPFVFEVDSRWSIAEYLIAYRNIVLEAYENSDYSVVDLFGKLNRDILKGIYSVDYVYNDNGLMDSDSIDGGFVEIEIDGGLARQDKLTIACTDFVDKLEITYASGFELVDECELEVMNRIVSGIVDCFINEDKGSCIGNLCLIDETERNQLLYDFNETKVDYPKGECIHELFEEQALKSPSAIAVVFGNRELTYEQLNNRSNELAWKLRGEHGVGPDVLVGMLLERSFDMIVGILGILKAGGAYVPIDPEYPAARINYVLEDSGAKVILSNVEVNSGLRERIAVLDLRDESSYSSNSESLPVINKPSDLIYCIYTSGSTGRPKGSLLEHRSLVNRLYWMSDYFGLNEDDVFLQKTNYTFDVSGWELLLPGLLGSRIILLAPGQEKNPFDIFEAIKENGVTVIHFVPSMLSVYLNQEPDELFPYVKVCVCSGEVLTTGHTSRFFKKASDSVKLYNLYGPTEAAIDVTAKKIEKADSIILLGLPVWNTQIYIVDENDLLCPVGVSGELCISGVQIGRGYLNRDELTKEKFVMNPFVEGERMYRTGDLAKWLPDGNLDFIGRMDDQVKVRGFRVELGEVETAMLELSGVKEAVVKVHEDGLAAYYVPIGIGLNAGGLRAGLSKILPHYMVPSYYVELESLPLTANGKVDRKALLEQKGALLQSGVEYVAPRDSLEETICSIYAEVLELDRIGIDDDFFSLGGHSLKAVKVIHMISNGEGYNMKLGDIFSKPTPRQVALMIRMYRNVDGNGFHDNEEEILTL